MKLLENLYAFKTVEYFGHKLIVPNWTKYITCSPSGFVIAWDEENKPWKCSDGWDSDGQSEVIAVFSLNETDWKETLIAVE